MSNVNASPEGAKLLSPARECWGMHEIRNEPRRGDRGFLDQLLTEQVQGQLK
jgi:hypothetical protein